MRECKHCFELKPLDAFYKDAAGIDGHKVTCKACVCRMARKRRATSPIGYGEHSIEDHRRMALIQKCFRKFDGKSEVVVPVNALNNPHPAKRACVIRPFPDKNRILISSLKGLREYEFELVSPQALLEILKELQLQVYLP